MSTINHTNIEEKFFDFVEGNLSLKEQELLKSFVLSNPEYSSDYEAWTQSKVLSEITTYPHTNRLLKKDVSNRLKWWSLNILLLTGISWGIASNYMINDDKALYVPRKNVKITTLSESKTSSRDEISFLSLVNPKKTQTNNITSVKVMAKLEPTITPKTEIYTSIEKMQPLHIDFSSNDIYTEFKLIKKQGTNNEATNEQGKKSIIQNLIYNFKVWERRTRLRNESQDRYVKKVKQIPMNSTF